MTTDPRKPDVAADKVVIRELVENWAVWRDARLWDRFRTVWHADGRMMATWFQGGLGIHQSQRRRLGARRAHPAFPRRQSRSTSPMIARIAQTKMTISQRAPVEGVVCDVRLHRTFLRFFARRDGRWGLVLRQPIYEKDRLDPVDPAAKLSLDQEVLKRFPEGYRHLAYLQTQDRLQGEDRYARHRGPELDALYAHGARWLEGGAL